MGIMRLERVKIIQKHLKELGSVAVAFSGGVDSTFLLYIAKEALGDNVLAITVNASATPDRDMEDVVDFLYDEGIKHEIIKNDGKARRILHLHYGVENKTCRDLPLESSAPCCIM